MIPSGKHNSHSQAQFRLAECQVAGNGLKTRAPQVGLRGSRRKSYSLAEKLAARTVKDPDGCWYVSGAPNNQAGHVAINHHGKLYKAHRVAWELAQGRSIPDGLRILHQCDHPRCVNPTHLVLGTQADNIADAVAKGRFTAWHRTGVRLNGQLPKTRLKAIQPDAQPNHDFNQLLDQQRRAEFVHE